MQMMKPVITFTRVRKDHAKMLLSRFVDDVTNGIIFLISEKTVKIVD